MVMGKGQAKGEVGWGCGGVEIGRGWETGM